MYGTREAIQSAETATGDGELFNATKFAHAVLQVTGTFVGTITFEGSVNGADWIAIQVHNLTNGAVSTTTTTIGLYGCSLAGLGDVRARISAYTSGSITVSCRGVEESAGLSSVQTYPLDALLEGGLTELIGINEQVDQNDYSGSIGVTLGATYSGEILSTMLYSTEDGSGAVQTPEGWLYCLATDPAIASGDTAMTAAASTISAPPCGRAVGTEEVSTLVPHREDPAYL